MTIIEQATKRLEELTRAGVAVPWAAAGLPNGVPHPAGGVQCVVSEPTPHLAVRAAESMKLSPVPAAPAAFVSSGGESTDSAGAPNDGPQVTLDLERLERLGHLIPTQVRTPLAEEFRQIKRPLLRNARAKDAAQRRQSLIMVTSSLPGEGKTFCAINLAMSLSIEIDTSVLLVDADVVRPEVLQRLGVPPQRGLLDLLTDPTLRLSDVVLKTNVPKLSILPSGARHQMSTELLASEAMGSLLQTLAEGSSNQIVIFDSPPMLVTTEAKVLAQRLGQVVLVVEASGTPRSAVMQAFAAVEQCAVVMSVMNKSRVPAGPGYGDYYG